MENEKDRLGDPRWKKWGPYLAERQWGTVREDYSAHGDAWEFTTHEMARSKAWRWGEEGIGGISDQDQQICFAWSFWNQKDPFLKERMFGLTNQEGNHGEDVKEVYYYLDGLPSHSYLKMLYKYPQAPFPYEDLRRTNAGRSQEKPEYELIDTGVFSQGRYFDLFIEYAKASPDDLLIRLRVINRSQEPAPLSLLPTLWFRNTWSWEKTGYKPSLFAINQQTVEIRHRQFPLQWLHCEEAAPLLFCENETNSNRLYGTPAEGLYYKDGINDHLLQNLPTVNPDRGGTKAAFHIFLQLQPGEQKILRLRLNQQAIDPEAFLDFDRIFSDRIGEADRFYQGLQLPEISSPSASVQRQAFAGLIWSQQYYYYHVARWLQGDPAFPAPPAERLQGRNRDWQHLMSADILAMPDTWEYPWFGAWDLAFHCIGWALLDPGFAKDQLTLLTHEWFMHPNGQLPAYEWSFSDANPPVHAWAAWRVFEIDRRINQTQGDLVFLETIFHKLLINFTWWVNRKDAQGNNIFEGGFLGMDNIGVFDRDANLPDGSYLEQSDGTSWMAMYSLNLMRIALELAKTNPVYQDMATKFFDHFMYIAGAMDSMGPDHSGLWDTTDEFFYDALRLPGNATVQLRVRSMVGLIPLFAVEVLDDDVLTNQPAFAERLRWFLENRPDLAELVSRWGEKGSDEKHLLSLLRGHRMKRILSRMLDEQEFLSPYGIRALSKYHAEHPFELNIQGQPMTIGYCPGESPSRLFGGNSNWRGPVWMPVNYLIIESLQRFHHYYGPDFRVEYPTGSGQYLTLEDIAQQLSQRLISLFLPDETGQRPIYGSQALFQSDPSFTSNLMFFEYFHGDTGQGLGASHQTGWTSLVAKLLAPR